MVTGKELAERLGMHPTSIQKAGFSMSDELDSETLIRFLADRRKAAGAWRPEKAAIADAWYCELTGSEPIGCAGRFDEHTAPTERAVKPTQEKRAAPVPAKRVQSPPTYTPAMEIAAPDANLRPVTKVHFLKSEGFMVAMLVLAILAQVLHTATFFYFVTPIPVDVIRFVAAVVVGLAVDSAALVKTIQSGRRIYLIVFAIVHFGINMSAHFRFASRFEELDTAGFQFWVDSFILSFAVAYAVFCYAEAFAIQKNAPTVQTVSA